MNPYEAALVITGICVFFIGFHNLDLAFNMDSNCLDTALDGNTIRSKPELYLLSLKQLFLAMIFFIIAVFYSVYRKKKSINFRYAK